MGNTHIDWRAVMEARYKLQRNWTTGRGAMRTFTGHTQAVSCVQVDGNRIVSGAYDSTIKVVVVLNANNT